MEDHKIKWKEVEARLMGNENLRWRRGLIADVVTKTENNHLLNRSQRILDLQCSCRLQRALEGWSVHCLTSALR